jgi:hypothetical protein
MNLTKANRRYMRKINRQYQWISQPKVRSAEIILYRVSQYLDNNTALLILHFKSSLLRLGEIGDWRMERLLNACQNVSGVLCENEDAS